MVPINISQRILTQNSTYEFLKYVHKQAKIIYGKLTMSIFFFNLGAIHMDVNIGVFTY